MCEYDSVVHGRTCGSSTRRSPPRRARRSRATCSGPTSRTTECPYFFSDLADWASLEYVGPASDWDEEEVRGSVEEGSFTIFYLRKRRVLAALTVGDRGDDLDRARELIRG